jgi:vancomycin permeability regulator SanA
MSRRRADTALIALRQETVRAWQLVRRHRRAIIVIIAVGAILVWGPSVYTNLSTRGQRFDLNETAISSIPKHRVAIVFGAGIDRATHEPTPYLHWRVETAVRLYKAGRVDKLLMTGDNSSTDYDEPTAMRKLAVQLGVQARDITLDYAGFNTYDSCYRAHEIFGLTDATLVTQGYHLPRAVTACRGLGMNITGVDAVNHGQDWEPNYLIREWVSTDKIAVQLFFRPHPAALGQHERIR